MFLNRRFLIGLVLKLSSNKTLKVSVTKLVKHKFYGKYIKTKKHYLVHDEKNVCKVGEKIKIVSVKPISKNKKWLFEKKIN